MQAPASSRCTSTRRSSTTRSGWSTATRAPGDGRAGRPGPVRHLRRQPARLDRLVLGAPGAGVPARPRLRAAARRRPSWPSTCCGTGWCCRTRRWPTTSTPTRSSPACWRARAGARRRAAGAADPMATAPDRLLRRLEWRVVRRLDGRLQGAYRTRVPRRRHRLRRPARLHRRRTTSGTSTGTSTARLDEPHVRQYTEDRELTAWLVLDRSASMRSARPGRGKDDGARPSWRSSWPGCSAAAATGSARCCTTTGGSGSSRRGTGRDHALRIGARAGAHRPPPAAAAVTTDLAAMLDAAASLARRRVADLRHLRLHRRPATGTGRCCGWRTGTRWWRCGSSTPPTTTCPRPA